MATFFQGNSDIQGDGLQTLYLMNPGYVGYSQAAAPHLYGGALTTSTLHAPPSPPPSSQHFVGIPFQAQQTHLTNSDNPHRPNVQTQQEISSSGPRFHYNLWGSVDQSLTGTPPPQVTPAGESGDPTSPQFGFKRSPAANNTTQGLSLTLSNHQQQLQRSLSSEIDLRTQNSIIPSNGSSSSASSHAILGSKYLKAAQQLLDEVVNVGKAMVKGSDNLGEESNKRKSKIDAENGSVAVNGDNSNDNNNTNNNCNNGDVKRATELTAAQRQELQMKKAKLVNMLDEVEQRYKQYHHQMQMVISAFVQAAGLGSAKSYTALALQTISKQFRCLKDAISAQIKAASVNLGEELEGGKGEGSSRLRFVDNQLRQQRALQQLGMMQHNAWRPQRGLPERAVSVLRAWLFEHFLHPYPKDSDKHMLAKQTGLTRSQVSNWFINARVRLWKPMVEEMYLEEMKDHEQSNSENTNRTKIETNKDKSSSVSKLNPPLPPENCHDKITTTLHNSSSPPEMSNSTISTTYIGGATSVSAHVGFSTVGSNNILDGIVQRSPKKPKNIDMQNSPSSILSMDVDMKHRDSTYPLGGFGDYSIGEITPRYHGNGSVSLSLGLPHCDNLSLSGTQRNFLSNQDMQLGRRLGISINDSDFSMINPASQPSHSHSAYDNNEIQTRKRFAAQLLHDFVA
ncbi:Homeobox KN domain [Dillenia turbinata]|uniref:Homeobox KN domain n=1 Tax=Dillenia turbinata TaxID=194707 RepID=A0AAN8V7U8_9MAGN